VDRPPLPTNGLINIGICTAHCVLISDSVISPGFTECLLGFLGAARLRVPAGWQARGRQAYRDTHAGSPSGVLPPWVDPRQIPCEVDCSLSIEEGPDVDECEADRFAM
jgi:hypothetical protein